MNLERLSVHDIPEIAPFLRTVWGASYGQHGIPLFSETYLRWLYGGPEANQTVLLGARKDGRIVAVKALLGRELLIQGKPHPAYLSTHLAVDPTLALADRLALISIADPHWLGSTLCAPSDVVYAFYDGQKPMAKRTEAYPAKFGFSRVFGTFSQMIAIPALVNRQESPIIARPGTVDDGTAISALSREVTRRVSVSATLSPSRVVHHWFHAPGAEVFVTESPDGLTGACCVYELQIVRGATATPVAILEGLLVSSPDAGIALLREAIKYAQRIHAKGVVLENASWLETPRTYGFAPSGRQMQVVVMSRQPVDIGTSWMVDVK